MKKAIIVFIVAALVLVATGLYYYSNGAKFDFKDSWHFAVIILLVAFALFVGFKRLSSARRGEPAEDELSKKILQKSAALSYYLSLYLWVFMIYIKDRVSLDTEELLGTGILGMAITFAICWIVYYYRGVKND